MRIPASIAATVFICLLFAPRLDGGETTVRGKVTYVAAGTVYTSLGREHGLRDSTLLVVVSKKDTIATVMVLALSTQSSSCVVVRSSRTVNIGDEVFGTVAATDPGTSSGNPTTGVSSIYARPVGVTGLAEGNFLELHGRIGAQYVTSMYNQSTFNITQPGLVVSLRGAMRDVPLRFDMYANFRTVAFGTRSPFAKNSVNQSRIYGLSLSYDDGGTVASLGRIIPSFSPSIGYVDGALLSRRFGNMVIGTVVGYQPDWAMRGLSTDYSKIALFAQYSSPDRIDLSFSAAYARTYYHATLDREAASLLVNSALAGDLFLYGSAELDLRKKLGEELLLAPKLTSAFTTLYYRVTSSLTLGLGVEALRSYYSFESVRRIPDSLLVNSLRSSIAATVSWYLPWGIALHETYAPRTSNDRFGQEYSNSSALNISDVLSTGLSLRGNYNTNRNELTTMAGYGLAAQATIARTVDLTLRFQENGYVVKQTHQRVRGKALGGDLMIFLTQSLTLLASYDRRDDYGMTSHAIFAEFGFKF